LIFSPDNDIIKVRSDSMNLENQRYGRNKNTLIDKSYIDSGEYRRKFDKATESPEINKTLYDCAKKALKHRSGTLYEDMYWIDGNTGQIIFSVTDSTDERAIIYTDKIRHTIKNRENIITLHTHPSSMPPSISDFNSCCENGYIMGFIACHDGKLFRYSSNQKISETLYNLYVGDYRDEKLEEFEAQLQALNKIKENHMINFTEVD
jgi:hypothetical protein